jgi:hypothetical protein
LAAAKARLIAQGLEQKLGIDYNEKFAPVVRWSTLRAMIALSIKLGWVLNHMDVITAYFNFKLKEKSTWSSPQGSQYQGRRTKFASSTIPFMV